MKLAIMQPYFFPYVGYFQLINSVDCFVIYDNIKYTKKGWINRNRYLLNGKDAVFSIPLKKDSDFLSVSERFISREFNKDRLLSQIKEAYKNAPMVSQAFPIFEKIVKNPEENLFRFIYFSVLEICRYLGIKTNIIVSSDVGIDHSLKAQNKVIAICKKLGASTYVNAIGGKALYSKCDFEASGLKLKFIKSANIFYQQFENEFVPWLSILDLMMFNSHSQLKTFLNEFVLE